MAGNDLRETAPEENAPEGIDLERHPEDAAYLDSLTWVDGRTCAACRNEVPTVVMSILRSTQVPICWKDARDCLGYARVAAHFGKREDYHPSQIVVLAPEPEA